MSVHSLPTISLPSTFYPHHVLVGTAGEVTLDQDAVTMQVMTEMEAWSAARNNRPLQFLAGYANTGETVSASVGNSKPKTPLNDESIFRLASTGKIMGGVMAAIAFEEGVLAPSDPIAKWIPEFAAEKMVGVAQLNADSGATEVVPLNRNITVFDLLAMQSGFSYGYWGSGQ